MAGIAPISLSHPSPWALPPAVQTKRARALRAPGRACSHQTLSAGMTGAGVWLLPCTAQGSCLPKTAVLVLLHLTLRSSWGVGREVVDLLHA